VKLPFTPSPTTAATATTAAATTAAVPQTEKEQFGLKKNRH